MPFGGLFSDSIVQYRNCSDSNRDIFLREPPDNQEKKVHLVNQVVRSVAKRYVYYAFNDKVDFFAT